jgi:hypothetical protein
MRAGPSRDTTQSHPTGEARLVPALRRGEACAELRGLRYLVASATPVPPAPGGLRDALDEAVEGALALRGALPPVLDAVGDPTRSVHDQVFRARALGAAGLAVAVPALAALADDEGVIGGEDGAVLAVWLHATRELPLVMLVAEEDRGVRVPLPVALGELCAAPPREDVARSSVRRLARVEEAPAAEAAVALEAASEPTPVAPIAAPIDPDATPLAGAVDHEVATRPERGRRRLTTAELDATRAPREARPPRERRAIPRDPLADEPLPAAPPPSPEAEPTVEAEATAPEPPAVEPAPRPANPVVREVVRKAEWRSFAAELDAAQGPKPVRTIERLFATRYMPLLGATLRGDADGAVRGVVDEFRQGFERSYVDGFAALRVSGKRPAMVLDAPEIAARVGRLNGARSVKLVLIDAMRFDVAERMNAHLEARLAGQALCVDRCLLWAALPTTTPVQAALLARGPAGLRDAPPSNQGEPDVMRARAVSTLRRERLGQREVMKLDLVEARMAQGGPAYDERLEALGEELAAVVARFAETLPQRTLVYVFGDHGFRLGASHDGRGTSAATQGGASPEEVLVPAYAWLLGGVH